MFKAAAAFTIHCGPPTARSFISPPDCPNTLLLSCSNEEPMTPRGLKLDRAFGSDLGSEYSFLLNGPFRMSAYTIASDLASRAVVCRPVRGILAKVRSGKPRPVNDQPTCHTVLAKVSSSISSKSM